MTILDLKDQIIKGNLENFYIFTGDEIGIINIYLNQMSKKLELPITRADSVLSIYGKCTRKSMFGNATGFYVIRNDKDITKEEKVYPELSKNIGNNVIVLLYDKIDIRLKFGKHFKDKIINFEKLAPNVLKSYIKKAINLSDSNIDLLANLCGGSYDMCMLEVDKVKTYSYAITKNVDESYYNKAFEHLLECGVIYQPEETDVFKFTDAVCNRHKKSAFRLAQNLLFSGNSSVNLLGTLYNSMKCIMLIQCCKGEGVCEITGLDNRQVYFNKKYCGKYRTEELVSAVKLLSSVIEGIKTGKIDDLYATNYCLVKIL